MQPRPVVRRTLPDTALRLLRLIRSVRVCIASEALTMRESAAQCLRSVLSLCKRNHQLSLLAQAFNPKH
jgi:hypothetical protein